MVDFSILPGAYMAGYMISVSCVDSLSLLCC